MPDIKQISDGGPDGLRIGQSTTDKVAFYGGTPVVRQTTTLLTALTAGTTTAATIAAAVTELRAALAAMGIIAA